MSKRVALAEDNSDLRSVVSDVLRAHGHVVVDVADGDQLEGLLATASFDLVITDLDMPGRLGAQVLASRRSQGDPTPFIVMTGAMYLVTPELLQTPRTWLLMKPFPVRQL